MDDRLEKKKKHFADLVRDARSVEGVSARLLNTVLKRRRPESNCRSLLNNFFSITSTLEVKTLVETKK